MKIQTISYVIGTSACNASCPFCVSKKITNDGFKYTKEKNKLNFSRLHTSIKLAERTGVLTALITGKGEPTLFSEQIND